MEYLIQMIIDGEIVNATKNANQIIQLINESDFSGIEDFRVYDVSELGKIKELHYVGWQPMCLIQLKDEDGNVVVSGYGEDH